MQIVKWSIHTGFAGATHKGEWEVPDGTTDDELEQWMAAELQNHIECFWERVPTARKGAEDAER